MDLMLRGLVNEEPNTLLTTEKRVKMEGILKSGRPLKVYWGTAPTGTPHVAYFVPMSKIADFLRAGCEVTILIADLHAYLDSQKSPEGLLAHRSRYYEEMIKGMLGKSLRVPIDKLKFARGMDFQMSAKYTMDMYRACTVTTDRNAKKAGADVVKQLESAPMSGLMYPILQALDEEYLGVDVQFGGLDQRKIFVLADDVLPKLGYEARIHLMNPMVPGIDGGKGNKAAGESKKKDTAAGAAGEDEEAAEEVKVVEKMSASGGGKIDLLDTREMVKSKVDKAVAAAGRDGVDGNGLLAFIRMVLFTVNSSFTVKRPVKHGGESVYKSYAEVEAAYAAGTLHPADLKPAVCEEINLLLDPIRAMFSTPEMQTLCRLAYPDKYTIPAPAATAGAGGAPAPSTTAAAPAPVPAKKGGGSGESGKKAGKKGGKGTGKKAA
jgi:tyrosyl-tRNA synthetase